MAYKYPNKSHPALKLTKVRGKTTLVSVPYNYTKVVVKLTLDAFPK